MQNLRFYLFWAGCFVLIAGCTVGPNYQPPQTNLNSSYSEAATNSSIQASRAVGGGSPIARWWSTFNDSELDSLIARAVNGNRDLRKALSRVRQARAQRGVVASGLLPEIDAT